MCVPVHAESRQPICARCVRDWPLSEALRAQVCELRKRVSRGLKIAVRRLVVSCCDTSLEVASGCSEERTATYFVAMLAVEVACTVLAFRRGTWRVVGAVLAVLVAAYSSLAVLHQLDGLETGEMCNGYSFEVLPGATTGSLAMVTALVAVALIALEAALHPKSRRWS